MLKSLWSMLKSTVKNVKITVRYVKITVKYVKITVKYGKITVKIPLAIWGGCWDPWFCRGPQRQAPKNSLLNQSLLSRVGSYLLQNQEPSTAKISDKENSCFLQNQEPHMWKHQNKSKNITCWVKTSKDASVEICVRVDSVEMFCWSLIL